MNKIKGFTLLEIIIATSLLALIALTCSIALRIGISTYNKITKNSPDFENYTINLYRMFNQLKHVCSYNYKGKKYKIFKGNSHEIEFISNISILSPGIPGFYIIKYEFQENTIWIRERRILDQSYISKQWTEDKHKFIKNVEDTEFKFLKDTWTNQWIEHSIPTAIEVKIKLKDKLINFIVPFIINKSIQL